MKFHALRRGACVTAAAILSACGGGGGGGDTKSPAPEPVAAPAALVDEKLQPAASYTVTAQNTTLDGAPYNDKAPGTSPRALSNQLVPAFGGLYSLQNPVTAAGAVSYTRLAAIRADGALALTTLPKALTWLFAGDDGRTWYVAADKTVGTLDATGKLQDGVTLPSPPALIDADGRFWITEVAANLAKVSVYGVNGQLAVSAFNVPSALSGASTTRLWAMASGPDGAIWGLLSARNAKTDQTLDELIKFNADGAVADRIDLSAAGAGGCNNVINSPDGALLVACHALQAPATPSPGTSPAVTAAWAKVTLQSRKVAVYAIDDAQANNIYGGTLGADGNIWFKTANAKVWTLGQNGFIQHKANDPLANSLTNIQAALDGRIWLVSSDNSGSRLAAVDMPAIAAPDNDAFAQALPLTGSSGTVSGSSLNASAEADEPAHTAASLRKSLWWAWTAPGNGTLTLNTCGSMPAAAAVVYTGDSLGTLKKVSGNASAKLKLSVLAGRKYQIAVDAFNGSGGYHVLSYVFETP